MSHFPGGIGIGNHPLNRCRKFFFASLVDEDSGVGNNLLDRSFHRPGVGGSKPGFLGLLREPLQPLFELGVGEGRSFQRWYQ